jgi:radical SAM protein with 4Fe4S-binding SPASM domain
MTLDKYEYVSQSNFWDYYLTQEDANNLLQYHVPKEKRKYLFNKYVTVINLETSSYCNRKCDYCPVAFLDSKPRVFIDEEHFQLLIDELRGLNFRGIVTMNLFNEPLAEHENFTKRLISLKKACPNSYVRINTNGDYLTKEILESIKEAGLNEILLTIHTANGQKYDDQSQLRKMDKRIEKLGLSSFKILKNFEANKNITYEISWKNVRILIVSNNWSTFGLDRGGSVEKLSIESRSTACLVPFREVSIDFNGDVLWCWNIFRDKSHSLGKIGEDSLTDIYFNKPAVELRRKLILDDTKEGVCSTCNVASFTDKSTSIAREKLLAQS